MQMTDYRPAVIRMTSELIRLVKIEASKDGVSIKEWVEDAVKTKLSKRGITVATRKPED